LNEYWKYKEIPKALFINGNTSLNIRKGAAFSNDKDRMVANAVFGSGPKDRERLGKGVYDNYGVAVDGFHISSSQFSIHYYFENVTSLNGFLTNLSECTRVGGYFIGTCYDGKTVFDRLQRKQIGEPYTIVSPRTEEKICEITKQYNQTGFPDDELSVGYEINVYQDTIQKTFREFLVNFTFLQRLMENYGFAIISKEEANKMDLPNGTGLFDELFRHMEDEMQRSSRNNNQYGNSLMMTTEEKTLSFMNRYFVFKKVAHVDTKKITKTIEFSHLIEQENAAEEKRRKEEEEEENAKTGVHKGRKGYRIPNAYFEITQESYVPVTEVFVIKTKHHKTGQRTTQKKTQMPQLPIQEPTPKNADENGNIDSSLPPPPLQTIRFKKVVKKPKETKL
jgi:hypothetical protein